MSDAEKFENEFAESIQKYFPPERIAAIRTRHGVRNDVVMSLSAHVRIKGNNVRPYDAPGLLEEISGSIIEGTDTKVVIKGAYRGRDCRVTISTQAD